MVYSEYKVKPRKESNKVVLVNIKFRTEIPLYLFVLQYKYFRVVSFYPFVVVS